MAKKILVVDDEPDIVTMLKKRLDSRNYFTITAQDGQEALDKIEKDIPDLLILDIMIPKIDGYSLFKILRSDPKHSNIPIIILTASEDIEYVKNLVKEGVEAYLNKPYKAETLLGLLKALLGE